jgi:hypothetical protein
VAVYFFSMERAQKEEIHAGTAAVLELQKAIHAHAVAGGVSISDDLTERMSEARTVGCKVS